MVLSTLQKEMFLINLKECIFMKRELIYLGFVIYEEGLKMDPEKVQAIVNWPTPKNAFKVKSFHGLASFYRNFIRSFSQICAPIVEIIKSRKKPFKWIEAIDRNFKLLKKKITENPVLALPIFDKFFQVETDASGTAIGVVFSQEQRPLHILVRN
jgi:hypothetical protein